MFRPEHPESSCRSNDRKVWLSTTLVFGGGIVARPKRTFRDDQVERKILFYKVRNANADELHPFDPRAMRDLVDALPFVSRDRYLASADGDDVCVWFDKSDRGVHLRLGVVRKNNHPRVEAGGDIRELPLDPEHGLVELTHAVFFDDGIVAVEQNFYGPRIGRLAQYLSAKFGTELPRVAFDVILKGSIEETLNHLTGPMFAQIRLRRSVIDLADTARGSLADAFRAQIAATEADSLEMVFRHKPRSRETLSEGLLSAFRGLIRTGGVTKDKADVLKVQALDDRTGRVEMVDLLRDQFIAHRTVLRTSKRQRAIDSASMFSEMERAYDDLHPQLARAVTAGD